VPAAQDGGDSDAALVIKVYLHRLRREIGAVSVSPDRLYALVFTGGVAEHRPGLVIAAREDLEMARRTTSLLDNTTEGVTP
jgi:acetate kinase